MTLGLALSLFGVVGGVGGIVAFVVALSNREIRKEALDLTERQNTQLRQEIDDLREDLDEERTACATQIAALQGQINALTGELGVQIGEKIGERMAITILQRIEAGGRRG